jgi:DNA-binding response OmpR family regulator
VEVDSEAGRGTTFRIYLPLAELPPVEVPAAAELPARGNAETILVAEDDEAVMDYLCSLLERNGYRVIAAKDGEDAIVKFNRAPDRIRLALLDVIMPGRNGNEVRAEIVAMRPDIKVIYLSGYTHEAFDGGRGFENGEVLLAKPVRPDELLWKVRELLAV